MGDIRSLPSFCFEKGQLTIVVSEAQQVGSCFEQELSYMHDGRIRREQFVGRSRDELDRAITDRQADLKGGDNEDSCGLRSNECDGDTGQR